MGHTEPQLGVNPTATFTVLDFLQLHNVTNPPKKFTPLLWTAIDAYLLELTDMSMSLLEAGTTKATLNNVLSTLQSHDKMSVYDLLFKL